MEPSDSIGRLGFSRWYVVGALVFGVYGIYRYQKILFEAEQIGERATCPACGVYARFKLVAGVSACCRKCSHEWRLIG